MANERLTFSLSEEAVNAAAQTHDELISVRAEAAMLREALKAARGAMATQCVDGCTCGDGWSHTDPDVVALVDAALSTSTSDWLDGVKAEQFERGWKAGEIALLARAKSAEAASDSYKALVDAGTAACAEVDARCAALEKERDALAAALGAAKRLALQIASIEIPDWANDGTWVAKTLYCNNQLTAFQVREARKLLAAIDSDPMSNHLARIASQARREALMDADGPCYCCREHGCGDGCRCNREESK